MEITKSREEREKEFEKVVFHLPEAEALLHSRKNVVSVSIACKEIAGRHIETMCYVIHVQKKIAATALDESEIIPAEIAGIPTDVVEIETATFLEDKSQYRPLKAGIQIAPNTGSWFGTLGCFAISNETGKLVLLSNHHVLYNDSKSDGDAVGQPDLTCCACCTCDIIAYNTKGILTKEVDAAFATIGMHQIADDYVISNIVRGLGEYANPGAGDTQLTTADAPIYSVAPLKEYHKADQTIVRTTVIPGERVRKVGRTTDRTIGRAVGIDAQAWVGIPKTEPANFEHQMYIVPHSTQNNNNEFAKGGDSGSVIINDLNQVVGLLMASKENGDPAYDGNYANCIHRVMAALKISIYGSPKAVITITPQSSTAAPFTATLSAAQSVCKDGEIIGYIWDLGDPDVYGTVATKQGKIITHTFNLPGTYTVTLTVTSSHGMSHVAKLPVVVDYPAGGGMGDAGLTAARHNGDGQAARQLSTHALMNKLQEDLQTSEAGKQVSEFIQQFRQEVLHLVNHNRKVTVAWQRKQGPAFIAQLIKAMRTSEAVLPAEVNGVHLQSLLQSMALVLEEEGSADLAHNIRQHQLGIFNLFDRHRTFEEIISAIHGNTISSMIR